VGVDRKIRRIELKEWDRGNEDKDNCRLKETEVFE
jgi:hypothetical protein